MVLKSGNFVHTRTYVCTCCHEMVLKSGNFLHTRTYVCTCCHEMVLNSGNFLHTRTYVCTCCHEMVLNSGNFLRTRTYVCTCCHEMVLIYGEFVICPYVCLHTAVKGERKKEEGKVKKQTDWLTRKRTNCWQKACCSTFTSRSSFKSTPPLLPPPWNMRLYAAKSCNTDAPLL